MCHNSLPSHVSYNDDEWVKICDIGIELWKWDGLKNDSIAWIWFWLFLWCWAAIFTLKRPAYIPSMIRSSNDRVSPISASRRSVAYGITLNRNIQIQYIVHDTSIALVQWYWQKNNEHFFSKMDQAFLEKYCQLQNTAIFPSNECVKENRWMVYYIHNQRDRTLTFSLLASDMIESCFNLLVWRCNKVYIATLLFAV